MFCPICEAYVAAEFEAPEQRWFHALVVDEGGSIRKAHAWGVGERVESDGETIPKDEIDKMQEWLRNAVRATQFSSPHKVAVPSARAVERYDVVIEEDPEAVWRRNLPTWLTK